MGRQIATRAARTRVWTAVGLAVVLATTTGCQTTQGGGLAGAFSSQDPCSSVGRNWGVVLGGLGGAVLGKQMGDKQGLVLGAALGAALGGLIGHDIDRRRCELATIAKTHQMDLVVNEIKFDAPAGTSGANAGQAARQATGLSVAVVDHGEQFASGSAVPTASGEQAFSEMAAAYRRVDGKNANDVHLRVQSMRILLIGHTDDTGSSVLNAQLSEARALAVARIFARHGFSEDQVFYQGAGETLPMADNRDEAGRARNRRVEIVDLSDDLAFEVYLASRRPNTAFYRPHSGDGSYESSELVNAEAAKPVASAAGAKPAKGGKAAPAKTAQAPKGRQPAKAEQTTAAVGKRAAAGGGRGAAQPARQDMAVAAAQPAATSAQEASVPTVSRVVPAFESMDFGGAAVGNAPRQMDVGLAKASGTFSFISSAHASSEAPLGSCLQDRPRISHGVKSLKSGTVRTAEYLPGLYNTSWYATVNGHLVALNKVGVLREGGALANKPELLLYENYRGDTKAKADYRATPEVNTYQGEKGLLYRVFVGGPVQCMDILVPTNAPRAAPGSNLIYPRGGGYFQTTFAPATAG
jgi:outer membrane protein OmpA-like peptidoglycan-associated protein